MTKILVTGAAGFIGSHLVDYLVKQNHQIFSVDDLSGGFQTNLNPKSHFFKLDLRKSEAVFKLIAKIKPQIIYHLAADASEGRSQFTPLNCSQRNYFTTLNLLTASVKNKIKRFVFTSSMSVYGTQKPPFSETLPPKPVDIYGIAKTASEQMLPVFNQVFGLEYVILRPHNVYGPRQNMADPYRNVIAIFINRLLKKKSLYIYGNGRQERSFSFIDDLIPGFAKAGFLTHLNKQIINLGPLKPITINRLAKTIIKLFFSNKKVPKTVKIIYLPSRPQEVINAYCTDAKAKKLLGFKNYTPLKKGLKHTIGWALKVGPQKTKYLPKLEINTLNVPITWKDKLI